MKTLAGSAVSLMARLVNLHSWRCKRFEGYLPASLNTCGMFMPHRCRSGDNRRHASTNAPRPPMPFTKLPAAVCCAVIGGYEKGGATGHPLFVKALGPVFFGW